MSEQSNPEPGWYPDPFDSGSRRYWDGSAWTDVRAPLAPVPKSDVTSPALDVGSEELADHGEAGAGSNPVHIGKPGTGEGMGAGGAAGDFGGPGSVGGAGGVGGPGMPAGRGMSEPAVAGQPHTEVVTWLWQSIVVTLLCCMPLGVPAIVFSSQAQSAINVGNIALALERAEQAKKWTLVSFWLGLIPWVAMVTLLLIPLVVVPFFTISPLYNQ